MQNYDWRQDALMRETTYLISSNVKQRLKTRCSILSLAIPNDDWRQDMLSYLLQCTILTRDKLSGLQHSKIMTGDKMSDVVSSNTKW